ncbi:MAG: hypothetical protein GY854_29595 [Deltaproteobacteria bacterium]|nr:hypothetical protein [Deltaproteobacteria bacterium]
MRSAALKTAVVVAVLPIWLWNPSDAVAGNNTTVCVDIVLHDMDNLRKKAKEQKEKTTSSKTISKEPSKQDEPPSATDGGVEDAGEKSSEDPESFDVSKTKDNVKPKAPATKSSTPLSRIQKRVNAKQQAKKTLHKMEQNTKRHLRLIEDEKSIIYLKRLIEHYISHEPGYTAAQESCDQTVRVELYPLEAGWTVFVGYSGTGREERVDVLYSHELSQFAERAALALLYDVPISDTINRENVLLADSEKSAQRIKGTNHFILSLGTQLRGGILDQADKDGGVEEKFEILTPMTISTGYRGRFENWGLEAMVGVGIGTKKTASRKNNDGGHIDFGGNAGVSLHFLRYFNPRGLTSFYLGAGSTFEMLWFSAIKAREERSDNDSRSTLLAAGLDVDGVFGWEFMRTSAVQFYLQGELGVPAYVVRVEDNHGQINTWLPAVSVKLGVVF